MLFGQVVSDMIRKFNTNYVTVLCRQQTYTEHTHTHRSQNATELMPKTDSHNSFENIYKSWARKVCVVDISSCIERRKRNKESMMYQKLLANTCANLKLISKLNETMHPSFKLSYLFSIYLLFENVLEE